MREITYAQALREALAEEMRRDERTFIMGEDVGVYGGGFGVLAGLIDEFGPERVRDTPISEAAIIGAAAGAALTGMRPIVEIQFSDFLSIAMDQLGNQAAKLRYMSGGQAKVPMLIRTPEGSGTGAAAQHSQSQEALYCHIPGLKVVLPSTPHDAKGLLKAAIRDDNPVVFFEQKLLYKEKGPVPEGEYLIPLGKADIKRPGRDLTIVAWGRMVGGCLSAAETVSREGIQVELIDPRCLAPLDMETIIDSVRKTGRLLVVHEAPRTGGFGGEILARICESPAFMELRGAAAARGDCRPQLRRLTGLDIPIPFSPGLEVLAVPSPERIVKAIRELVEAAR